MSHIGAGTIAGTRSTRRTRARVLTTSALSVAALALAAQSASAAPTWLGAAQLSPQTTCNFLAGSTTIVSTADGTGVAAWQRRNDGCLGTTRVEVAVRPPGGTFATQPLSDPTAEATNPKLAIGADGTVIAVWTENGVIRFSQRPPGGSFGAAQTIAGSGPVASAPAVAIGAHGAVAAWVEGAIGGSMKVASKAPGAASFGAPAPFISPVESNRDVDVAMNEAGAAVVTWQTVGAVTDTLRAAVRPVDGSFSAIAPVFTTSADADHIDAPKVEMDPAGRATALWTYFDSAASTDVVKSAARQGAGDFGPVGNVSDPNVDSGKLGSTALALDADNDAIAVWWATTMQAAVRPPVGAFGPVIKNVSPANFVITAPSVAFDATGRATAAWLSPGGATFAVQSASLAKGAASFGPVINAQTTTAGPGGELLDGATPIAVDDQGNALTMWRRGSAIVGAVATTFRMEGAWLDAVGPDLLALNVPTGAIVGDRMAVSVNPVDRLSAIASTTWNFGDGSALTSGTSVGHTYAHGGTYNVTITSTDAVGNATVAGRIVNVPLVPGDPGFPGGPVISGLKLSRSVFSAALKGASVRPANAALHRWTRVSYTLSDAAKVSFSFEQPRAGRSAGTKCNKPSPANRGHKSCIRYIAVKGGFTRTRTRGGDSFTFTGRLGGHRLKAGRYRFVVRATGGGEAGPASHASFRIHG